MSKRKALAKLADLAGKAGRWLGLAAPALHTGAVEADRFDDMIWHDVMGQATGVRELIRPGRVSRLCRRPCRRTPGGEPDLHRRGEHSS
jgi:hypothetical protein